MLANDLIVNDKSADKPFYKIFGVFGLLALACFFLFIQSVFSSSPQNEERLARIKAAYIFKVLKFTSWPDASFVSHENVQVCIVDRDQVADNIVTGFKGRTVQEYPIVIRAVNKEIFQHDQAEIAAQFEHCHLLYLSKSVARHNEAVIALMKGKHALLVSTSVQFAHQGGMVEIMLDSEADQIRFVINLDSVKHGGLAISSKLLKFSEVIESATDQAVR